jgi:hypothetical protein
MKNVPDVLSVNRQNTIIMCALCSRVTRMHFAGWQVHYSNNMSAKTDELHTPRLVGSCIYRWLHIFKCAQRVEL